MTEKETVAEKEIGVKPFFMTSMMMALSELETEIWDNHLRMDKVRMQNIIIMLKSELIQIDKENKDIITVDGLRYRRVME